MFAELNERTGDIVAEAREELEQQQAEARASESSSSA